MKKFAILVLTLVLCACTQMAAPKSSADYARLRLTNAEGRIQTGHYYDALTYLESDLNGFGSDGVEARQMLAKYPSFGSGLVAELNTAVQNARDKTSLTYAAIQIDRAKAVKSINADFTTVLVALDKAAVECNKTDQCDFLLSDKYKQFPSLVTPEAEGVIFQRTLDRIKAQKDSINSSAMFNWLKNKPVGGAEYKTVEAALPQLKLSRTEWEGAAMQIFPSAARQAVDRMTVFVFLQMDEADRLYQDDIGAALASINSNLRVISDAKPGAIVVKVRKLQFDGRQLPDSQQTVMYQDYQVDTMKAVLLMPRNAVYAYDVVSGGTELDYGFLIKLERDNKALSEEVVRDKISRSYWTCRNQRIQNVFGGVQPADFVANDDQQRRCSGGGSAVPVQSLRMEALRKVADRIASNPAIAQSLGK